MAVKNPDEYLKRELSPELYERYQEGLLGRKRKNFCDDCIAVSKKRTGGEFYPRCRRSTDEWAAALSQGLSPEAAKIVWATEDPVEWAKQELDWHARWYQCQALRCTSQKIALRQGRRCLAKGTLVMTPAGPTKIEDLKVGDIVYDENGNPVKVFDVIDQGIQYVYDLVNHGILLASCTLDHKWLIRHLGKDNLKVKETGDCTRDDQIARQEVVCPLGPKNEPLAYVLGALLGDGCCRGPGLVISSGDEILVAKVASLLNTTYKKNSIYNYSWYMPAHNKKKIPHYFEWCHNKYAHEKTVDLNVIRTWDRESLLSFLAGVLDTDGHVEFNGNGCKEIAIVLSMQSLPVVEAFRYGLLALWGVSTNITLDNRPKYKNGPCHTVSVKNIYQCKRILKELTPHLVLARKQYQPVYDTLVPHNMNPLGRGFKGVRGLKNPRLEPCYDITVDSPSSLYLLANGLVTHNSGKTSLLAIKALHLAATKPGAKENEPYIVLVISPYENQLNKIFEYMRTALVNAKSLRVIDDKRDPQILAFANKGTIRGFTAGSKAGARSAKIRGEDGHAILLDETSLIRDEDMDAILAIMASHEDCKLYYSTTPSGLPDKFKAACEDPKQRFKEFWFTSHESPAYSEDADETFKAQMDRFSYEHEIIATFGEAEGAIFSPEVTRKCLKNYQLGQPLMPDEFAIIGVDSNSKSTGTHAVVLAAKLIGGSTHFRVIDIEVIMGGEQHNKKSVQRLIELYHKWNPVLLCLDKGYADDHIERLIEYSLHHPEYNLRDSLKYYDLGSYYKMLDPMTGTEIQKPYKPLMVGIAQRYVQQGHFTAPKSEDKPNGLIDQMLKFHVKSMSPSGQPKYSQGNEHTLTAMMLGIMGWVIEVTGFDPVTPATNIVNPSFAKVPDGLVMPVPASSRTLPAGKSGRSLDDEPGGRPRRISRFDLKNRSNVKNPMRRKTF